MPKEKQKPQEKSYQFNFNLLVKQGKAKPSENALGIMHGCSVVSPPPSFSFFLFQDSHLLRDRFSKINFPFWKMAYIQKCLRTSYLFLKKKKN